jgi:hypothetical protein
VASVIEPQGEGNNSLAAAEHRRNPSLIERRLPAQAGLALVSVFRAEKICANPDTAISSLVYCPKKNTHSFAGDKFGHERTVDVCVEIGDIGRRARVAFNGGRHAVLRA